MWLNHQLTSNCFLGLILQGSIIELNGTSATGPAFAGTHLSSSVFEIVFDISEVFFGTKFSVFKKETTKNEFLF